MNDNFVLVEYSSALNNIIAKTFKDMRRVKLTCLGVSKNFLIFGASSGGIYIFKREPCEFLKLIPSKEGSTNLLVISSDEKHVAIASIKGIIIVIHDFLGEIELFYQVYKEHDGNVITSMNWNGNDLYCGDNTGKVSVVTFTSLLSKAIFQAPSASLMQLDSPVIQLDNYQNYLIVSTTSKTYLCDTEKEIYKQIGKKLRNGNFGACFSSSNTTNNSYKTSQNGVRNSFTTVNETELFSSNLNSEDVKIYCARPGARLWEANFEASVLRTYQFKNSLQQLPTEFVRISKESEELEVCNYNNIPNNFNFGTIFRISNRLILTHNHEGVYIIDPKSSRLVFGICCFTDIKQVKITTSLIYIWRKNLQIHVISVIQLEELIISTLYDKQYNLCAELCVHYSNKVLDLLPESKKLHLVLILQTKVDENMRGKLQPILNQLEDLKRKISCKTLVNGIVAIDNGCLKEENEEIRKENKKETQNDDDIKLLYKQFDLNKTHKDIEIPQLNKYLQKLDLDEIFQVFQTFLQYVKCTDENAEEWCSEQILKQCVLKNVDLQTLKKDTLSFIIDSFLKINKESKISCKCNYPLPKTHKYPSKFYNIGCKVLKISEKRSFYLEKVPYLFKSEIERENRLHLPVSRSLLVQFSDKSLFQKYLPVITYDLWDDIIKLVIKLNGGICLNCGDKIDTEGAISWTDFGQFMVTSIGAVNTIKLLQRYAKFITKGDLDARFYQTCIFSASINAENKPESQLAVNLVNKSDNSTFSNKFENLMEKYLQKKYIGKETFKTKSTEAKEKRCSLCKLPLNIPILDEISQKDCGHIFHCLCLMEINNTCNICKYG